MPTASPIVTHAQSFVSSGKYSYGQKRGAGYLDDNVMDCSEFVFQAYRAAGRGGFPAINSAEMAKRFKEIKESDVVAGDIIYWTGHVAIVKDPAKGLMLHAASTKSGLREDNYKTNTYWKNRGGRKFLRYEGP
jgi:cell wall-associated NlpC family hydrolase